MKFASIIWKALLVQSVIYHSAASVTQHQPAAMFGYFTTRVKKKGSQDVSQVVEKEKKYMQEFLTLDTFVLGFQVWHLTHHGRWQEEGVTARNQQIT